MAKKRISAKDKNEQRSAKKAIYQQASIEREKEKASIENVPSVEEVALEADTVKNPVKKSGAKANGLKSILIMEDKIQMTSFGKGNNAILEKEVKNDVISDINIEDPSFDASVMNTQYEIKRRGVALSRPGYVDKNIAIRQDLIRAKDKLEEMYFGKAMNDNVHIQVIYNILDMEKILAGHIDNIIYSICNVLKVEGEEPFDLIGDMGGKKYETFRESSKYSAFKEMYEDERLRFFGGAFYDAGFDIKAKKGGDNEHIRTEEEVYYMLSLLGSIRQFTKHGGEGGKQRTWLYSLDKILSEPEKKVLDNLYGRRLDELNKGFLKKSAKDIAVAIKILKCKTPEEKNSVVEDYYRYVVCKDARNIGFSVKTLRERMIENHAIELKDKSYNSVRSKMYKLFDFIIFMYYSTTEGEKDARKFVESLRVSEIDDEKEMAYVKQANMLWQILGDSFKEVENELGDGSKVKKIEADEDRKEFSIDEVKITADRTSYFSKLMFMMTLFINGKEINDLLTTIINKYENIQSFEDIMTANNLPMFKVAKSNEYDYSFLENAGKIADEIRVVKSVSRMEKPLPSAKDFMYIEAVKLLGLDDKNQALSNIKGRHYVATLGMSREDKKQYYLSKNPGKTYDPKEEAKFFKNDNSLRNFIANNIIESSRFMYLIRYTNIESAREFAKSKPIVKFVLNKIPETQIDSYWSACCFGSNAADKRGKVNELTEKICKFDTAMLTTKKVKEDKQAMTAIIGLYLTVVYLVVKNLVNVNSRYTIAIHALERDTLLIDKKATIFKDKEHMNYEKLFTMTNRYIEMQTAINEKKRLEGRRFDDEGNKIRKHSKKVNHHGLDCIVRSKESIGNETAHYHICRLYRNAIAHLGAVTNAHKYVSKIPYDAKITSFFALYHFFMQEYLMNHPEFKDPQFEIENSKVKEWAEKVEANKGYCRDWIWSLNSPFAYNPPRYKCLSIEDLFYKDKEAVVRNEKN